jgi:hypothetical protein
MAQRNDCDEEDEAIACVMIGECLLRNEDNYLGKEMDRYSLEALDSSVYW